MKDADAAQRSQTQAVGWPTLAGLALAVIGSISGLLLFTADGRYVRPAEAREVAKDVVQAEAQSKSEAADVERVNRNEHEAIRREITERLTRIEERQGAITRALEKLQANIERMHQRRDR